MNRLGELGHLDGSEQIRSGQRRRADSAQLPAGERPDNNLTLADLGGGDGFLPLRHRLHEPVAAPGGADDDAKYYEADDEFFIDYSDFFLN